MPSGPPWPPGAGADFFSGISQTIASVVSIRPAIDAAFCSAERVTFAGSITPDSTRSSYLSVWTSSEPALRYSDTFLLVAIANLVRQCLELLDGHPLCCGHVVRLASP